MSFSFRRSCRGSVNLRVGFSRTLSFFISLLLYLHLGLTAASPELPPTTSIYCLFKYIRKDTSRLDFKEHVWMDKITFCPLLLYILGEKQHFHLHWWEMSPQHWGQKAIPDIWHRVGSKLQPENDWVLWRKYKKKITNWIINMTELILNNSNLCRLLRSCKAHSASRGALRRDPQHKLGP